MTVEQKSVEVEEYQRPVIAELLRFVWIAVGPASLFFSAAVIWQMPPWTYSYRDCIFMGAVVATLLSRFLDIRFFRGLTTENHPATMRDFSRYAIKLLVIAAAGWTVAQYFQA